MFGRWRALPFTLSRQSLCDETCDEHPHFIHIKSLPDNTVRMSLGRDVIVEKVGRNVVVARLDFPGSVVVMPRARISLYNGFTGKRHVLRHEQEALLWLGNPDQRAFIEIS